MPGGVLAIDYGERKSGFATTDPLRLSTQPLDPVRVPGESAELLDHVAALLAERDVSTILVGLPLHMDGRPGGRASATLAFVERLRRRFPDLEVRPYDERLTSKEAEALLRGAGYRGQQIRARRDSWSALVLLRDWIASGEPR